MNLYFSAAPLLGAAFFIAFAASANASPAITINAGKLLTSPGMTYPAVTSLPAGVHINILACDKAGWCHVNRFSRTGWIPFANLDVRLYSHAAARPQVDAHPGQTASVVPAGSPTQTSSSTAPNGPASSGSVTSFIKPGNGKTISALGGNSSAGSSGGAANLATQTKGEVSHQSTGLSLSGASDRPMATIKATYR